MSNARPRTWPRTWVTCELRDVLESDFPGAWGSDPGSKPANVSVLRSTNLDDEGHIDRSTGAKRHFASLDLDRKRLLSGDILLEASGGGPGKPVGRVAIFESTDDEIYASSNFFRTLRPRSTVNSRFLAWYLQWIYHQPTIWQFQQQTTGIINLKYKDYLRQWLLLPGVPDQRRIAEILGTADEAIQRTERLIVKLEQAQQSLLYDLLSPHGLIPAQWSIRALGELVDQARPIVYGILMPGRDWHNGVPVIKVKDIQGGIIQQDNLLLTSPSIDEKYRRSRVLPGDLLFTIRGTVGRMAFVPAALAGANITQDTARISITKAERRFVEYYLQMPASRNFIDLHTLGQAVKGINLRDVRRIPIALPSIEEQRRIAETLDAATERIRYESTQAGLLRSVRRGLMDDLLTGRVRVKA